MAPNELSVADGLAMASRSEPHRHQGAAGSTPARGDRIGKKDASAYGPPKDASSMEIRLLGGSNVDDVDTPLLHVHIVWSVPASSHRAAVLPWLGQDSASHSSNKQPPYTPAAAGVGNALGSARQLCPGRPGHSTGGCSTV